MSRILIIEDEEAIADLEKDYLELSGFEVSIRNTGDEGLRTALADEYDLIVLDLMLPGMDGFEIWPDMTGWWAPARKVTISLRSGESVLTRRQGELPLTGRKRRLLARSLTC